MPRTRAANGKTSKRLDSQQSVNQVVYKICDILRRSGRAGALQYVPELTWILFLRILDEREAREQETAEALGNSYTPSLAAPYRWRDWAAPYDESLLLTSDGRPQGWKRKELQESGALNSHISFVNAELLPYLKSLGGKPNATPRQKVISQIISGTERTGIDTERNMLDVLDRVHQISEDAIDPTHVFPLSQVFEGLLLKMGEKGNDGGQFFTPREIIRAMVRVTNPRIGETVYDPASGTGGFLAESYEHMKGGRDEENITAPEQVDTLKRRTFYGREKDNTIYPIALANLILHGIDEPHIWHGNALTNHAVYEGLFTDAPALYDVILMNPPFGGKEGRDAQKNFEYETSATQVLFLQHALKSLKHGGRCGIVLDEGVLFRTNETAFVKTKRKLLNECDLWCVVSLPGGVFSAAGAGVKTNLLFFTKGTPTEKIWYYDLSDIKVGKKTPFTVERFADSLRLLPEREDSERSWTVDFAARLKRARADAAPFRANEQRSAAEAHTTRERVKELKRQNRAELQAEIDVLTAEVARCEAAERENRTKAQAIEDAAYDLKAVNPHAKSEEDARTPDELIEIIEIKEREISDALTTLRAVRRDPSLVTSP